MHLPARLPACVRRRNEPEVVPLREALVQSWEGRTYYDRLAQMADEQAQQEEQAKQAGRASSAADLGSLTQAIAQLGVATGRGQQGRRVAASAPASPVDKP